MLLVQRWHTFETNSSSVHALVYLSKDQYQQWQQGNYLQLPTPPNRPWDFETIEPVGLLAPDEVQQLIKQETQGQKFGYLIQDDPDSCFLYDCIPADVINQQRDAVSQATLTKDNNGYQLEIRYN